MRPVAAPSLAFFSHAISPLTAASFQGKTFVYAFGKTIVVRDIAVRHYRVFLVHIFGYMWGCDTTHTSAHPYPLRPSLFPSLFRAQDPSKAYTYNEHSQDCTVAAYAPSGNYMCSGGPSARCFAAFFKPFAMPSPASHPRFRCVQTPAARSGSGPRTRRTTSSSTSTAPSAAPSRVRATLPLGG